MVAWDSAFCEALADRGFRVLRFDNRDVGLSTKFDGDPVDFLNAWMAYTQGEPVPAPYRLSDMAADAVSLLDHLGLDSAHVVGASMGGMIAQTMAIEHPERVRTLTSIMSTTGEPDVGQPTPEALERLFNRPPPEREAYIAHMLETSRVIGSPDHFDENRVRERVGESYDRCFNPLGVGRQLIGILASGPRAEGLAKLNIPTLVIHGSADPLVSPDGGERTAAVIPGAKLLIIEGMGHDQPPVFWAQIVEAITQLAVSAVVA
jgi:pimeloyl-ACP methyl ester carboxylesterase